MIELTAMQRAELQALLKQGYKWLARDASGLLVEYEQEPVRRYGYWATDGRCRICENRPLGMLDITWDGGPWDIERGLA